MNGPKSRQRNHKIAESFQSKTKAPAATQEGDLGGFGGVLSTSIAKQSLVERGGGRTGGEMQVEWQAMSVCPYNWPKAFYCVDAVPLFPISPAPLELLLSLLWPAHVTLKGPQTPLSLSTHRVNITVPNYK